MYIKNLDKIIETTAPKKSALLFSIFFFLMGIATGAALSEIMSPIEKSQVLFFLQGYVNDSSNMVYPSPFLYSLGNNLFLLLIIGLSGIVTLGFPLAFFALLYKGMTIGFVSGLLIDSLQLNGIMSVLISLLPQNLFLIPVFLLAVSMSATHSFLVISHRRYGNIQKNRLQTAGPYIIIYLIMALIIVVGCFIESLLSQIWL